MPKRILIDEDGAYDLAQVSAVTRRRGSAELDNLAAVHCNGQTVDTELPFEIVLAAWSDYVMTNEARRRLPTVATASDDSREPPPASPVDAGSSSPAE